MERRALQATVAAYPYLQGLWAVPLGIVIAVSGVANLQSGPSGLALLALAGGGLALAAAASAEIAPYYGRRTGGSRRRGARRSATGWR